MPRNLIRLEKELALLELRYGLHNIEYPSDGSWIKILNYPLPRGKYNFRSCTVLIIVPENYDLVPVSEVHIDKDLRLVDGKKLVHLPHTLESVYDDLGYQWISIHPGKRNHSLIDFVNTLTTYLTDPKKYERLVNGG